MPAQGVVTAANGTLLEPVLRIWREVLGGAGSEFSADSNFFLSGGDSLQLTRVLVRLRERLGVDLDLRDAARFSTPGKMARCCEEVLRSQPGTHRAQFRREVAEAENPDRFPCTAGQAGLWLAEQLSGISGVYNTALVVRFAGDLQARVLAHALVLLSARHELLRAGLRFDTRQQRVFTVIGAEHEPALASLALPSADVDEYLRAQAAQPFDLVAGPLWRARLVASGACAWSLLLCIHHCIADGWSAGVLLGHLAEAYNALLEDAAWRPDHCDREFRHHCLRQEAGSANDLHWWRARLEGADRLHSWPDTGKHRWPFAMACEEQVLDEALLADVTAARCAVAVDLSAFLLGAVRLALLEHTGIGNLCIGMPVNLRDTSAQEEGIGCFVNLLVMRARVAAGMDACTVLRHTQEDMTEALARRVVPLPELARHLQPALLPSGNPWCDVLFACQNLPWVEATFNGLEVRTEPLVLLGQHPLKVEFIPRHATCVCRIEYARAVLSRTDAQDLFSAIRRQLAWLSRPGEAACSS